MTQPTEYVVGFAAGTSAVVFVYRQVFAIIREHRQTSNGTTSAKELVRLQNASAELRRLQNREDLRDIMHPYLETQTEALVSMKESLGKLTYIAERYWK